MKRANHNLVEVIEVIGAEWLWMSSVVFCSTRSKGTMSISTSMPVLAVNSSLASWLATMVGGVASEMKRIVVPLYLPATSFSQLVISGEAPVSAMARGKLRPGSDRGWPSMVAAKPESPSPAMPSVRRNSRLVMRRSAKALALFATKVLRSYSFVPIDASSR